VPRYPHERFRDKSGMGYRGDAILQFDWTVGMIVEALEKAGILDNTLIVLTSDNGPVVDDGYADKAVELLGDHRPWGEFRGGKYSNFEAGTRVPFIVHWPAVVKPGISDALFSHIDMFGSMEKLTGQDMGEAAGMDSQNYLATLTGEDKKGRDYVIEASGSLSISDGEWKYITPNKGPAYNKLTNTELGNSEDEQLYNLHEDVGEKQNVAKKYPDKVKEMKQILEQEKQKGFREEWVY
jgi:arylsulfatase A-like enzyme